MRRRLGLWNRLPTRVTRPPVLLLPLIVPLPGATAQAVAPVLRTHRYLLLLLGEAAVLGHYQCLQALWQHPPVHSAAVAAEQLHPALRLAEAGTWAAARFHSQRAQWVALAPVLALARQ